MASYQSSSVVPLNTIYSIKRNFEQNINSLLLAAVAGQLDTARLQQQQQDQLVLMPSLVSSRHTCCNVTTTTTYPLVSSIQTSRRTYACRHLSFLDISDIRPLDQQLGLAINRGLYLLLFIYFTALDLIYDQ